MYATQQNIIDRISNDSLLIIADRDDDGAVDTAIVDEAISDATAEIDTYVAAKYDLPLAVVPKVLTRLCVDIAVYRLSVDADLGTEERRKRYEDAVKLLVRISEGKVSLGLEEPAVTTNGAASVTSNDRRFKRKSMNRLL